MEPFRRLRGLRDVTLSSDNAGDTLRFVAYLSHAIHLLDASQLERLSIHISKLTFDSAPDMFNCSPFVALSAEIARKWVNGEFGGLEELSIAVEMGNGVVVQPRVAKEAMRQAGFLSSLPEEKVRVVLVAEGGTVMCDARSSSLQ